MKEPKGDLRAQSFSRKPGWQAVGWMALFVLFVINWQAGGLRFTSFSLDYLAFITATALPWVAVASTLRCRRGDGRTLVLLTLCPITGLSMLFSIGGLMLAPTVLLKGHALEEPVRRVRVGRSEIVAYRGSPSAMSSFSIQVCREWPLLPGLKWTRLVHSLYPANDVSIEVLDPEHVRLAYPDRKSKYYPNDPVVVTVPLSH